MRPFSPHPVSPHLTPSHPISPHPVSHHPISLHFVSTYPIPSRLTPSCFIPSRPIPSLIAQCEVLEALALHAVHFALLPICTSRLGREMRREQPAVTLGEILFLVRRFLRVASMSFMG